MMDDVPTRGIKHSSTSLFTFFRFPTHNYQPRMPGSIIICAGLSCLDLQLLGCTSNGGEESIETYEKAVYCAGGSASMTSTTLALLIGSSSSKSNDERISIHVLTKFGDDFNGSKMIEFYQSAGAETDLVIRDPSVQTSMSVLPVFSSGKRGCFVNLACNEGFLPEELLNQMDRVPNVDTARVGSFLFGYPHLMRNMQGDALKDMLRSVRIKMSGKCLVGVDLNGVSTENHNDSLLNLALGEIDVLHLNEEEASIILSDDPQRNKGALHDRGCAVVLLSLGSQGSRISVTPNAERLRKCSGWLSEWEPGTTVDVPAFRIEDGAINTNGAGDALFAGFCLGAIWQDENETPVTVEQAGTFASLVAWQRCNLKTRDGEGGMKSASELMDMVRAGTTVDVCSR